MKNKYVFTAVLLLVIFLSGVGLTWIYIQSQTDDGAEDKFTVITSFYPMYIAAQNIVGDCKNVELSNLSEPTTGCMHDYQLTTQDMKKLSVADAFIVNGGGIENFLADVAKQYPELTMINACENVSLLDENAHAWMSIPRYMAQVREITDGLVKADRKHSKEYQANCDEYMGKLEQLNSQKQAVAARLKGKNIVIFHEAFAYIAKDFGLHISASLDLDEERQVSAGEVKNIVNQINSHQVAMVLAEKQYGQEMSEAVQAETGVKVVYLSTCVRGDYRADSYLEAMQDNLELLESAVE